MDEVKSDEEEIEVVLMGRVSGLVEADKQDCYHAFLHLDMVRLNAFTKTSSTQTMAEEQALNSTVEFSC